VITTDKYTAIEHVRAIEMQYVGKNELFMTRSWKDLQNKMEEGCIL
jgi:hypothetical protein